MLLSFLCRIFFSYSHFYLITSFLNSRKNIENIKIFLIFFQLFSKEKFMYLTAISLICTPLSKSHMFSITHTHLHSESFVVVSCKIVYGVTWTCPSKNSAVTTRKCAAREKLNFATDCIYVPHITANK